MEWIDKEHYVYGKIGECKSNKMAGFDLDSTLIKTKSGNTFPKDCNDWIWTYSNVRDKLHELSKKDYKIVIITNQAGIKTSEFKLREFKKKISMIYKDISVKYPDFVFEIYVLNHKNTFRKPFPTILDGKSIDRDNSFYCGDGAGRDTDHTDTDIKFAHNTRLRFMTPEYFFLGDKTSRVSLRQLFDRISFKNKYHYEPVNDRPELILMIGYPASGKSYISKRIQKQVFMNNINKNKGYMIDIISLDETKTKSKMKKLLEDSLKKMNSIIIDNTNLTLESRKEIIDFVKERNNKYYVRALYINTDMQRCRHNNMYRYYKSGKHISDVVYKTMCKKFVKPNIKEGIDKIDIVNLDNDYPIDIDYFLYFN